MYLLRVNLTEQQVKIKNLKTTGKHIIKIVGIAIILTINWTCKNELETATLSLYLTDAPFPVELMERAEITVTQIEIRQKKSYKNPYINISTDEFTINLLELTNGQTLELGNLEIPVGEYDLIRLLIPNAKVVLKDGQIFNLIVPSGAQTGLKIFFKQTIIFEQEIPIELLLDFDVNKSFIPLGNINTPAGIKGFNFKPVIKVSDMSISGSLTGTVSNTDSDPLEGVTLSLTAADTVYTCTFSDVAGNYTFIGLEAGTYNLTAEFSGYLTQITERVKIKSKKSSNLNIELITE